MQERDEGRKEDFVMSGKYEAGTEREEPFRYAAGGEEGTGKLPLKTIVIAGAGLLLALVVVLMIFSGSPRSAEKEQIKSLDARLKQIEEKLAKLEWIDTGLARLDRKEKDLSALSERITQIESGLGRRIDQIAREAAKPAPKPEPQTAKPEAPAPRPEAATKPAAAAPKADRAPAPKTYVVQKGDTLYSIARRHDTTVAQLLKLNNLSSQSPIRAGQKLTVAPAKTN